MQVWTCFFCCCTWQDLLRSDCDPSFMKVLCDQTSMGVLKATVYTLCVQFFVSTTVLTTGEWNPTSPWHVISREQNDQSHKNNGDVGVKCAWLKCAWQDLQCIAWVCCHLCCCCCCYFPHRTKHWWDSQESSQARWDWCSQCPLWCMLFDNMAESLTGFCKLVTIQHYDSIVHYCSVIWGPVWAYRTWASCFEWDLLLIVLPGCYC